MRSFLTKGRMLFGGAGMVKVLFALLAFFVIGFDTQAQPDYAAAQYIPPACTKWYTGGNGHSFVVIHDMEGYYQTTISYLNRCDVDTNGTYNVDVSVYYAVNSLHNGSDTHGHSENNTSDAPIGEITQFVRESNYAWHVLCWNTYMFGTEHEGFVNDPAWYSQGMYQSSAGLQRHLCEKYNIAKDRNHVIGHDEHLNPTWTNWVVTNGWAFDPGCNNHTDPGQYWNWTYFMSLLTADTNLTGTYWDVNGATAGFGATPTGTWGLSASNWNGVANGTGTAALWISPGNAIFSADIATNAYTVTVSGTQTVYSIQVLAGNPTFTGGGFNFTGTGTYYSNYVAAGLTATFNSPFTGSGMPDKWGTGTAVYNAAATPQGTSFMTVNQGTIAIGNDSAFGPNKFTIGEPTGANAITLKSANAAAHTLANNQFILYTLNLLLDANGDLTLAAPTDLRTTVHTITVSNNNSTFSGTLTNTGGITKAGPGTLIFSGAGANTYSGATTVSSGTLKLNKNTSVNAVAGSSLVVNSGATVLLGAANQIVDTIPVTLGGGTFNTAGLSETAGTLKVTGNSLIDLGAGANVLKFAASSGVAWTAGTTLTVSNWSGAAAGGGSDQFFVGTTSAGLTAAQLALVSFVNPSGFNPGSYEAKFLSTGELVPSDLAITTQPVSQTVAQGQSAAFSVTATGSGQLGYQWKFNNANIGGATSTSYTVTSAQPANAGNYTVTVTNATGGITSVNAALAVNVAPSITTSPTNKSVVQGQVATFSVAAAGSPLNYQWTFNAGNIAGATASSYTIASAQTANAGSYAVVVSNALGTATSGIATLTVIVPPSITTSPTNKNLVQGQSGVLTVVAAGTAPLAYQWTFNAGAISGATTSSYTVTNAGSYAVVVTNSAGSATSATAIVTVSIPPSLTTPPASKTVARNQNAVFSVVAAGTAPLSYQWTFNGGTVSGATATSVTITSAQTVNSGSYAVIVTNLSGTVTSTNAVLTVVIAPAITTPPTNQTIVQGQSATFVVANSGTAPFGYQWTFNTANISGANTNSFVATNAGTYAVVVTNFAGTATSANATLTVNIPPTITNQPVSQSVLVGTNVSFSAGASGTGPLAYHWIWNGTNIAGATTNQLTLTNVTVGQSGNYALVVTNIAGSVTSSNANLNVHIMAAATFSGTALSLNGQFSFTVTGVAGAPYAVQSTPDLFGTWVSVLTNISPFTFTDTNVSHNSALYYRAVYAP